MGAPGTTPGPWWVNPLSAWVEIPTADAPICAMLWPTDLRSEDETFANARQIAASDEMYDALDALDKHWLEDWTPPGDEDEPRFLSPDTIAIWRKIRAALSNARGASIDQLGETLL